MQVAAALWLQSHLWGPDHNGKGDSHLLQIKKDGVSPGNSCLWFHISNPKTSESILNTLPRVTLDSSTVSPQGPVASQPHGSSQHCSFVLQTRKVKLSRPCEMFIPAREGSRAGKCSLGAEVLAADRHLVSANYF